MACSTCGKSKVKTTTKVATTPTTQQTKPVGYVTVNGKLHKVHTA